MIDDTYKNIAQGQSFNNYTELQSFLGEKFKKYGKSRELQIKDWQRYFDFHKNGQKFIITSVRDIPSPKEDYRGKTANRSIYSKRMENLLLNLIEKNPKGRWIGSKGYLAECLGLVGKAYRIYHYNKSAKEYLVDSNDLITKWELDHFFQRADSKLYQIINTALRSMEKRNLIEINTLIFVRDSKGSRLASNEESNIILQIQHEVLDEFGWGSMKDVYWSKHKDDFYKRISEVLYERYSWHGYYALLCITSIVPKNQVISDLDKDTEKMEMRYLNSSFIRYMKESAIKKYNSMVEKSYKELISDDYYADVTFEEYSWFHAYEAGIFYPPSSYIESQKYISDLVIPIDAKLVDNEKQKNVYRDEKVKLSLDNETPIDSIHNKEDSSLQIDFLELDMDDINSVIAI